jgi:hypothetical protein
MEYDALGRLIRVSRRYDGATSGKLETLKYYHDGANVLAEYDTANNLSRRHVHGTTYVNERAILLEGGDWGIASRAALTRAIDSN